MSTKEDRTLLLNTPFCWYFLVYSLIWTDILNNSQIRSKRISRIKLSINTTLLLYQEQLGFNKLLKSPGLFFPPYFLENPNLCLDVLCFAF